MEKEPAAETSALSLVSVPAFWPFAIAADLAKKKAELDLKRLKFLTEEIKIHTLRPKPATPHAVRLDLRTMVLRDYGKPGGLPTLVDAPYAGHTALVADYAQGQSLVATLLAGGIGHVALTDWKSATLDMKDFDIDNYLEEMIVAIEDLGGRVNLVGLCQGGWLSAMIAARFPDKVNSLVIAGAPIDTDAGDGIIKDMAHATPLSFYEDLVKLGGGLLRGEFMLRGWKNMHPEQHYFRNHIDLFEHIDDPAYLAKEETFYAWYETTVDLPGRWYLQAITQLFKENRFAKGEFVGLGRTLNPRDITCPLYLLAGASDDITTPEQVMGAKSYVGTPKDRIVEKIAPGGHIGLFMGSRTLKETWPEIAKWIGAQTHSSRA
jgi:polyhydroxyalkanoate depolymerase